ncbi:MAG: tetratricopeptide repeat protein [Muribaculaceae bacterium]|nr:tetratricopeptide repeat protein [Muribaculaceae bacterium]
MKWLTAVILAFAMAFPAFAQTDADQVIAIGRNVMSMDDYMLSIQYFNQAIKAKPYLAEPYYLRAFAKMQLEDYEGAEQDCSLSIERNKFLTETYKLRGFVRQQLGKDSLAVTDYDEGLRYNPQDKYFLFYKAVAEGELHRYDAADSTYSSLLRLYPRFEDGFAARGRMNALRGDTVQALADVTHAIELSRTSIQPYLIRADIRVRQKNWEGALEDINEAIRLKPRDADYYLNRAFIRYNLDDFQGALADYNYTLELEPYNTAALFNRALLRYEVRDLNRAAADLEEVLRLDPENFHARYNRGLINLERGNNKEALADFQSIATRYPRFHPAFYAMAQAYDHMGQQQLAVKSMLHAENLIKAYVKNPEKNPLDRPTIAAGKANDGRQADSAESEEEVMDRFNQLVTAGNASETQLAYNDRIKGRVQDRDVLIEIEPMFMVSLADGPASLKSTSNYFRELEDFNNGRYIGQKLYLSPVADLTPESYESLFSLADKLAETTAHSDRAADWIALGVARSMLKDSEAAVAALNEALRLMPGYSVTLMARAYARLISGDPRQAPLAVADYDQALKANPRLVYACHNKGNIYYNSGDYTSALSAYNEALRLDPAFAPALYNRGITYLRLGNKRQAFADLSKAGELGTLSAYNLLKRMKQ